MWHPSDRPAVGPVDDGHHHPVREWRGSQRTQRQDGYRAGRVCAAAGSHYAASGDISRHSGRTCGDLAEYNEPLGDEPGVLLKTASSTRGSRKTQLQRESSGHHHGHDGEIALATGSSSCQITHQRNPCRSFSDPWYTGIHVTCAPSLLVLRSVLTVTGSMNCHWNRVGPFVPDYLGLVHPHRIHISWASQQRIV